MPLTEIIQESGSTIKDIHLQSVYCQLFEITNSVHQVSMAIHGLSTVWIIWTYGRLTGIPAPAKPLQAEVSYVGSIPDVVFIDNPPCKITFSVSSAGGVQELEVTSAKLSVRQSLQETDKTKSKAQEIDVSQTIRKPSRKKSEDNESSNEGAFKLRKFKRRKKKNAGLDVVTESSECNSEEIVSHISLQKLTYNDKKPFHCQVCGRRFKEKETLSEHLLTLHADEMGNNGDLEGIQEQNESANQEIKSEEGSPRFRCKTCDAVFRLKRSLMAHERLHKGEKPFSCPVCERKFRYRKHVIIHTRNMHTSGKAHHCGECDNCYDNRWELIKHKRSDHKDVTQLFCSNCKKSFKTINSFKSHMKRFHTGENSVAMQCPQCGKMFAHENSLRSHVMRHNIAPPHVCSFCGKSFHEKNNLEVHMRTHSGERPFQCSTCGQKFSQPSNLKMHEMRHSGKKSFMCELCSKCFATKDSLQLHFSRHSENREHACQLCERAFFNKRDLHKHMRVHTGVKPYTCEQCGRSFAQNWNLKAHVKTVHEGEKRCPRGESFMKKDDVVENNPCFFEIQLKTELS